VRSWPICPEIGFLQKKNLVVRLRGMPSGSASGFSSGNDVMVAAGTRRTQLKPGGYRYQLRS